MGQLRGCAVVAAGRSIERLNVHRYTAFFATKPSPTEALLLLWEARHREQGAAQGLLGILRGMGRFDAAHLLEHDLQLGQ